MKPLRVLLLPLLLVAFPLPVLANSDRAVEQLLQLDEAPDGVVFEIVTGDPEGLQWALPLTRSYIEKIRQRFPDIHLAVVTHGQEQFALQKQSSEEQQQVHRLVQSLTTEQNVPVHVCGTYAGWRGLTEEDFPDYVDVAAAGPAQINDYVSLGYQKIVVRRADN
jgi:intracellular sulfur oxidation DsrE/DsrF family protein